MFAKVFSQIFDSSIAHDFMTRHVFMDLLVLADSDGTLDMTPQAISRRTNVPLKIIEKALNELSSPDAESRTPDHDGRRLVLIDEHRTWGWQIVNYAHYRAIRDEEGRRAYFRNYQRERRAKSSASTAVHTCTQPLNEITYAEEEEEAEAELEEEREAEAAFARRKASSGKPKKAAPPVQSLDEIFEELRPIYPHVDFALEKSKIRGWKLKPANSKRLLSKSFVINWLNRIDRPLTDAAGNEGLYERSIKTEQDKHEKGF